MKRLASREGRMVKRLASSKVVLMKRPVRRHFSASEEASEKSSSTGEESR